MWRTRFFLIDCHFFCYSFGNGYTIFIEAMRLQNQAEDKRRDMARKIKSGFNGMEDAQIQQLMDECTSSIEKSDALWRSVKEIPDIYQNNFSQLRVYIDRTRDRVKQVNEIGATYLASKPNKRKAYIKNYM